jgi:hypothetical protein
MVACRRMSVAWGDSPLGVRQAAPASKNGRCASRHAPVLHIGRQSAASGKSLFPTIGAAEFWRLPASEY